MTRATLLALALMLLGGCSTVPHVVTDHDRQADFGRYQTFGFMPKTGEKPADKIVSLTEKRIRDEIARELQRRGYQQSPNPDMLVNVKITTKVKHYPNAYGYGYSRYGYGYGYFGYRRYHRYRSFFRPYFGYHRYSPVYIQEFRTGTFVIELVDAAEKQLIWQGSMSKGLSRNPERTEEIAREAVRTILQQYPHRANRGISS